jgi:hypothetical protein
MERYRKRDDEEHKQSSDIDIEREEECGICMEMNSKIVLPNCNHAMCLKCYNEWYFYSLSLTLISLLSCLLVLRSTKLWLCFSFLYTLILCISLAVCLMICFYSVLLNFIPYI